MPPPSSPMLCDPRGCRADGPPPMDLDQGGAGGVAVKFAALPLRLASLGDSPAVRRDAPPRSNRGRKLAFAAQPTTTTSY